MNVLFVDQSFGLIPKMGMLLNIKEKEPKKAHSIEELLRKEESRIEGFDKKFQATAELEKKKRKQLEEKFKEVISKNR